MNFTIPPTNSLAAWSDGEMLCLKHMASFVIQG